MRLVDLDPRWIEKDGVKVGFVFKSPTPYMRSDGTPNPQPYWQSCFFQPTPTDIQRDIFEEMFGDDDFLVQGCFQECAWAVHGEMSFDTLTVSPSLDGSRGGLWHGFIQNGCIVGGL